MTKEERSFYANPYCKSTFSAGFAWIFMWMKVRILASPIRRCFESGWALPRGAYEHTPSPIVVLNAVVKI